MGAVSSQDCDRFRGLIALEAFGRLPESERPGLVAHLDGCRECREDGRELTELSALLPAADLGNLDEEQMPGALPGAVLGRLRSDARRERRTRSLRYVLGGAAAAAAVTLGLALSLGGGVAASRAVALTGGQGVHASLRLTPEAWGTSLRIEESGQRGGQVLWVSMRTTSGKWWNAGTYRTMSGHAVQVDLACALGLANIRSVWVRDSAGNVVLHAYLD